MPAGRTFDNDDDSIRPTLLQRLRGALLKPQDPDAAPAHPAEPETVEELQAANRSADDKERLVGLLAAPVAAAIGFAIITALVDNDPPALKNGLPNSLHVSVSLYHEVFLVLLAMSVAMLVLAWIRKRLFLGIVMALYGLTVFNLHYWGFGIPFLLFGAWMLVRSYRIQQRLRLATGGGDPASRSGPNPGGSKRYTPPTARRRRPLPRAEDE
jgi:hypothetical protein